MNRISKSQKLSSQLWLPPRGRTPIWCKVAGPGTECKLDVDPGLCKGTSGAFNRGIIGVGKPIQNVCTGNKFIDSQSSPDECYVFTEHSGPEVCCQLGIPRLLYLPRLFISLPFIPYRPIHRQNKMAAIPREIIGGNDCYGNQH